MKLLFIPMNRLPLKAFKTDGVAVLAADDDDDDSSSGGIDFDNPSVDSQPGVDEGPHDRIAHSFKVYDHRVPGQIHFNKKDMDLKAGENADYDSYGDTQGDSHTGRCRIWTVCSN